MENNKAVIFLRKLFSSEYLPIVSAVVVTSCYYLGWDIVSIWYFCLCGVGILLTCKDVTPIFSVFLLMGVMVSVQHTPSILISNPSDYFTRPAILTQCIIAITVLVGLVLTRIVESVIYHRFKITPVFFGLSVFVAALLLNGIFSEYHTEMNLVYALFLAVLFLGIFSFANGNIQISDKTFERIAFAFIALLAVLAIELIVAYATYDNLIVDGVIVRDRLSFGWGTYNNFGMYLTMCIPAPFYLAARYKHGWAFTACAIANIVLIYLSMSRQAIVMGAILFVVCSIWLIIRTKGKARILNAALLGGSALVTLVIIISMREQLAIVFSSLLDSIETGSSRTIIWKDGIDKFLNYPLFGAGFYSRKRWIWGQSGFADILPVMYHNTFVQLFACGGIFGFAAYAVHRVQTVISFIRNITHDRIFITLTIAALLMVSLLDNHLFYLFPTIIYSMLVGVLTLSEKRVAEEKSSVIKEQDEQVIAAA